MNDLTYVFLAFYLLILPFAFFKLNIRKNWVEYLAYAMISISVLIADFILLDSEIKHFALTSIQLFIAGIIFSALPSRYFVNKWLSIQTVSSVNAILFIFNIWPLVETFSEFSAYLSLKMILALNISLIFGLAGTMIVKLYIASNHKKMVNFFAKIYTKNSDKEKQVISSFLGSDLCDSAFGFFIYSVLIAFFMAIFSIVILI